MPQQRAVPISVQARQTCSLCCAILHIAGIFGSDAPTAPVMRTNMTKSSLEGGIFGGYNHVEAPISRPATTPRMNVETMECAGAPIPRNEAFKFSDDASAPLQPLPSARRNNHASSIAGGIFGSEPVKHQPAVKRNNPNASSIEGGM